MMQFLKKLFTRNVGLKIAALVLALILWFYVVNELHKGSEDDRQFLKTVLPSEGLVAKKLAISPVFTGKPRYGYFIDSKKVLINPEYCIVVGSRELLGHAKFAYTLPIDVTGANKTFTKSVPLSSVAPGVFMEETLVQVTVPVEKEGQQ